jgi:hypothetical protein
MACLRYKFATSIPHSVDKLIDIATNPELLRSVFKLFGISTTVDDVNIFDEINKVYLSSIIDPAWSKQMLTHELNHWSFIARLIVFGSKDISGEQVDPLSQRKPLPDLVLPAIDPVVEELFVSRLNF